MVNDRDERVPKIFISYSHDSPDHKKWVGELASTLVKNGIDIILDQWDLGLGDDIAKFMETSVSESDRVLMICTETYVRKANEGKGGVGYEAMIVSGELVRDLGTSKFIPVVRQKGDQRLLPKSVSTRFYVDLSDDQNFDDQFELLLRELHKVPASQKPPLGKNPFAQLPSGTEVPSEPTISTSIPDLTELSEDIPSVYHTALDVARKGDLVVWRRMIKKAISPISDQLIGWRKKYQTNLACINCGIYTENGNCFHHVKSRGSGGCDSYWNLMPLCFRCHERIHRSMIKFVSENPNVEDWLLKNGWYLDSFRNKWVHY